ncbi:MAG: class I SAM-dependent methyltransferase [Sulfurovum sp.]|nr:class I SAM-dependent methyltransferase [Sulfurovum sp.]
MANTTESLDLYAKVEDLLENSEAIETLYGYYYDMLSQLPFDTLLDVGCGSGAYLVELQKQFPDVKAKGIDLSAVMVERAKAKGVDAEAVDLCQLQGQYDVITAVFDMMNYLPPQALAGFFDCIRARLNEGGLFIFDVNTLYGFENVAVGAFIVEDETRFLAIDSDFEAGEYRADFTLFEKRETCYEKSQETIRQYFHTMEALENVSGMKCVSSYDITLYGDDADKVMVVLQKQ